MPTRYHKILIGLVEVDFQWLDTDLVILIIATWSTYNIITK